MICLVAAALLIAIPALMVLVVWVYDDWKARRRADDRGGVM